MNTYFQSKNKISDEDYLKTLSEIQADESGESGKGQLNELYDRIMKREKFSYDADNDALYRQYRDIYQGQGKLAMKDSMGQAAALTGGYGSSYAQSAGQQEYDDYIRQVSAAMPDFYDRAKADYDAEGERLGELYAMTGDAQNQEYSRTMDKAAKMAQYGDFSAYKQLFGEEEGTLMENTWLLQNADLALKLGLIDQTKYAQLVGGGQSGGSGGGFAYFKGDGGTEYNPYKYENAKGKSQLEVQKIQAELGLTADGIWGKRTEAAYNKSKKGK